MLADRQPFLVSRAEAPERSELFDVFSAERLLVVPLVARSLLVGVMVLDPSSETERYTRPRLIPSTSFTIRLETLANRSNGKRAQSAVMKSSVTTARIAAASW